MLRLLRDWKIIYKLFSPPFLTTCFEASPLRGEIKNDETYFTTLKKNPIQDLVRKIVFAIGLSKFCVMCGDL